MEECNQQANGICSHAEGFNTTANGFASHAEGSSTISEGATAHAEGYVTNATGEVSHTQGYLTTAEGYGSHAEGYNTLSFGDASHAEGGGTVANGLYSHAEGQSTLAAGAVSHAEGFQTVASSSYSHTEGKYTLGALGLTYLITASDDTTKTITLDQVVGLNVGDELQITKTNAPALLEVPITAVNGLNVTLNTTEELTTVTYAVKLSTDQLPVHAEGHNTLASGESAHAEGSGTAAYGAYSHAEGNLTVASQASAHAEGTLTKAFGIGSHSEGNGTIASGENSHAQGASTIAMGANSHAEGSNSLAASSTAHAEGVFTLSARGTLYTIIEQDDTTKTITLNSVENLSIGNYLQIKINDSDSVINVEITNITGQVVTVNTNVSISNWAYAVLLTNDFFSTHTEGRNTLASGASSHAEGYSSIASGNYSHTEGNSTLASGLSAHSEGDGSIAQGDFSHAQGKGSFAGGFASHAEGAFTIATYSQLYEVTSYDSGAKTITLSNVDFLGVGDIVQIKQDEAITLTNVPITSIENQTITLNTNAQFDTPLYVLKMFSDEYPTHAEGNNCVAAGDDSHAEGYYTVTSNWAAHAEGLETKANGVAAHAEGMNTQANGPSSHAEGSDTNARGDNSHAEGYYTLATGLNSHSQGYFTLAASNTSHVEGAFSVSAFGTLYTITSQDNSARTITLDTVDGLIVGDSLQIKTNDRQPVTDVRISNISGLVVTVETTALILDWTHAVKTSIDPFSTHAEGRDTLASGAAAHAEGMSTLASGHYSHAEGYSTAANVYASHVGGQFNRPLTGNPTSYSSVADAFVIGNGADESSLGNAFRVTFSGATYGLSAFNATGADYAEYFEWKDGNPEGEDRVGYFVTMDGREIRKATGDDEYILGVVSTNPAVIGNSYQDDWSEKYVKDEWERIQYHYVDVPAVLDKDGKEIRPARRDYLPIQNPNWDPSKEYIPREKRKEWAAVGMMGQLLVRDDGTCQVNSYCKTNTEGIATASTSGYRVIQRLSPNIVRILLK